MQDIRQKIDALLDKIESEILLNYTQLFTGNIAVNHKHSGCNAFYKVDFVLGEIEQYFRQLSVNTIGDINKHLYRFFHD